MPNENPPNRPTAESDTSPTVPAAGPPSTPIYAQPIIVQNRSWFGRIFGWMGWLGLLVCLPILLSMAVAYQDYFDTTGGIQERFHSLNPLAADKIAIIEAAGTITLGERSFTKHQVDRIRDDENVRAIVLRVNSPGGSVSASDYLLHHLNELRKEKKVPLVVSMGSMAASGGYYIAMAVGDQEDVIFAEPTTTTGSIGVVVPHYNVSKLMNRLDIVDDSIVSNPRKRMLSMTQPENAEHRELIQDYVNQAFDRFKEIVKSGRPAFREDEAALDKLATGEIFTATKAHEHGLVDRIGFVEDAIERAIELASLDKSSVRVVRYQNRGSVAEALGLMSTRPPSLGASLLDSNLITPQAYYVWTSLPGLTMHEPADGSP